MAKTKPPPPPPEVQTQETTPTQETTANKISEPKWLIELKKDVGQHKAGDRLYAYPSQLKQMGLEPQVDYRPLGTARNDAVITFNP